MPSKTIKVPNISCGHCTATIEREISELDGITSVEADKDSKIVTVKWREPPTTWNQITDLFNEIGYPID